MDRRPTLLVVDDDAHEASVVAAQLGDFARVEIATSGAAALEAMKCAAPDLVVLDAEMPAMSGYEVLDAMRRIRALDEVPVVVLAANDTPGFELRGLSRGAIDAISKPIAGPMLRTRVRAHLRGRMLSSELRAVATIDPLTQLANRRTFFRRLHEEHRRSAGDNAAMHLLLVDIDQLGAFNARYGRDAGDACLERVAHAVRDAVRVEDVVARIEGGRIAVLLTDTNTRGAAIVARRLGEKVRALAIAHDAAEGRVVTVSVVIGHQEAARSATTLVERTERALRDAKNGERGQVWFYDAGAP